MIYHSRGGSLDLALRMALVVFVISVNVCSFPWPGGHPAFQPAPSEPRFILHSPPLHICYSYSYSYRDLLLWWCSLKLYIQKGMDESVYKPHKCPLKLYIKKGMDESVYKPHKCPLKLYIQKGMDESVYKPHKCPLKLYIKKGMDDVYKAHIRVQSSFKYMKWI